MATNLADLTDKVRYLVGDYIESDSDIFTYNTSDIFTLSEDNIGTVSTLYVNDVDYGDSNWSYASGKVTLLSNSGISTGDTIEIAYTYYPNYSATSLENYTRASLVHISANNYKDYIVEGTNSTLYPDPTEREKNLICLIASILIDPDNKSYNLPDVRVVVPKDLPTKDKISRTIALFKKDTSGSFSIL